MNSNSGFIDQEYNVDLVNYHPRIKCMTEEINNNSATANVTFLFGENIGTTNYSVFLSFYFGDQGSGGTYDLNNSIGALHEYNPMVHTKTGYGFQVRFFKSSGQNIHIYLNALVVFHDGFNHPTSYK